MVFVDLTKLGVQPGCTPASLPQARFRAEVSVLPGTAHDTAEHVLGLITLSGDWDDC